MTNNINLLPEELNKSKGSGFLALLFKRIAFVVGALVFVGVGIGVAFVFFLSNQLKNINSKNLELTDNIKSLSQTEQRLFLVKDRISKIERVLADKSTESSIGNIDQTVSSMSSQLSFSSVKIEGSSTALSLTSKDSLTINQFLDFLIRGNSAYTQVLLKDLGFNSILGYSLELQLF